MSNNAEEVKCTILTLRSVNVMVPSASIAEIISATDAANIDGAPDWYLGKMVWRGVSVPLVSYEAAAGSEAKKVNLNTQVAVFYSVNQGSRYPYIGLVISGVPHVTVFNKDQIISDSDSDSGQGEYSHPMVAQKTRINGVAVNILDLGEIEKIIADVDEDHPVDSEN